MAPVPYELLFAGPVLLLLVVTSPEQYLWAWPAYLAGGYLWGFCWVFQKQSARLRPHSPEAAIAPACHLFPGELGPSPHALGVIARRGSALTYTS